MAAAATPILLQLTEALHVLVDEPCVDRWLLMLPAPEHGGPAPLAWKVKSFLDSLLDLLRTRATDMRRQCESVTGRSGEDVGGGNALSRLLSANSPIPRIVHTLAYAQSPQLRSLGEILKVVFLHEMAVPVHNTFATDAAEWLWMRVVLPHPLLLGGCNETDDDPAANKKQSEEAELAGVAGAGDAGAFWLKLHDPKVDNLARNWGFTWLPILTHCNWSSDVIAESQVYVASAWWMAALIADVVHLEDPRQRHNFVEKVITQLPTPSCLSTSGTGPLTPTGEAVYEVVRQLLLSFLEKYAMYQPTQLVAAILYVAGALPASRVEVDGKLKAALRARFEKAASYIALPQAMAAAKERPQSASAAFPAQTLLQYGPAWLVALAKQASKTIDECIADQERRLQQFEWEEKSAALEEAQANRRNEQDLARLTAAEVVRKRQLQRALERQRNAQPAQGLAALSEQVQPPAPFAAGKSMEVGGGKKRDRDAPGAGPQQQLLPSSWLSAEEHAKSSKRPDPFNNTTTTTSTGAFALTWDASAAVPAPSASQVLRQQANEDQLRRVQYADTEEAIRARLFSVVGHTDLLQEHPYIGDIVGTRTGCLAPEIPVLPEIFVSRAKQLSHSLAEVGNELLSPGPSSYDAGATYAKSFVPHIAIELRYGICKDFEEIVSLSRTQGYVGAEANRGGQSQRPRQAERGDTANDAVRQLSRAFPLSRWLAEKSICATYVPSRRDIASRADPNRIDFDVAAHVSPHTGRGETRNARAASGGSAPLAFQLSENDILLALLPLSSVLPAWFTYVQERRANGQEVVNSPQTANELLDSIPPAWRSLGCFPQVCYVSSLAYGNTPTTLSTYPLHDSHAKRREKRKGGSHQHWAAPPPLPFLHALRLAFGTGGETGGFSNRVIYLKRLGSLGQAFTSVHALFAMHRTIFANTLYDPKSSSVFSKAYYDSFHHFLTETPDILRRIRARLLLRHTVNDGQAKSIAAALYAALPRWDEGPALSAYGDNDGSDGGGGSGTGALQSAAFGNIPLGYYTTTTGQDGGMPSIGGSFASRTGAAPRFTSSPMPEILIVEGPPGTGKTQTIGALTLNLLHYLPHGGRLLLCAPSNCAVDEAVLRVKKLQHMLIQQRQRQPQSRGGGSRVELVDLLRVGVRENIDDEVLAQSPPIYLDDRIQFSRQSRDGSSGGRRNTSDSYAAALSAKEELIKSAPLIFSTLGSLNQVQRYGVTFDVVIVDEASQATEPDVLQALLLAKKRCILVGDSKQLQPTILCSEAARSGLKRSLLVRLLANGHRPFILRTQFRMHRDICYFPNMRYYGGILLTDASVERRERPSTGTAPLTASDKRGLRSGPPQHAGNDATTLSQKLRGMPRSIFVDVPDGHMERASGRSLKNVKEARAAVAYMRQLRTFLGLSIDEFAAHVGIITFYRAQCIAITRELSPQEQRSMLQIATVDSFQGKEKDIIFICCVRTADEGQLRALRSATTSLSKRVDDAAARNKRAPQNESSSLAADAMVVVDVDASDESAADEEGNAAGPHFPIEDDDSSSVWSSSSSSELQAGNAATVTRNTPVTSDQQDAKKPKVELTLSQAAAAEAGDIAAVAAVDEVGRKGLGFLVDRHRINVALTRAKELCVVFGHRDTILAVAQAEATALHLSRHLLAGDGGDSESASAAPSSLAESLALYQARGQHTVSCVHSFDAFPTRSGASTLAVMGADREAAGSPTTLDSSKEAVRAKLKRDDEDPLALAALIMHASNGGTNACHTNNSDEGGKGKGGEGSMQVVDGASTSADAPVRAVLCEFPKDPLMEKLQE